MFRGYVIIGFEKNKQLYKQQRDFPKNWTFYPVSQGL